METGQINMILCVCARVFACVCVEMERMSSINKEFKAGTKQNNSRSGFVNNKTQVSLTRSILKE